MNKRGKQILLFSLAAAIALVLLGTFTFHLISAAYANITLNVRAVNTTLEAGFPINITIIITEANFTARNITAVNITLPLYNFTLICPTGVATYKCMGTNGTNVTEYNNLTTNTNGSSTNSSFANTTRFLHFGNETFLILNQTPRSFWFNATASVPGIYNIIVNVSSGVTAGGDWNTTNITLTFVDSTDPVVEQFNATSTGTGGNTSFMWNGTNASYYNNFTNLVNFSCDMTDAIGLGSVALFVQGINPAGNPMGAMYVNSTPEIGTRTYTQVIGTYNQTNFTQLIDLPGDYKWWCQAIDTSGNVKNSKTNYTFSVNSFSLTGWVKDSSFVNVSGANVSLYEYIQSAGVPPTEAIIKSKTTGASGRFEMNGIYNNYSNTLYRLKIKINDSNGVPTEIGPTLPPMPRDALAYAIREGSFTTQAAVTLVLYAYTSNYSYNETNTVNKSENSSNLNFGYEIIDQAIGFPIESLVQGNYATVNVTVPANRNYTVMFVRDQSIFRRSAICAGPGYFNKTDCASPPSSLSITSSSSDTTANITTSGVFITINKSLDFAQYNLSGCLNVLGNNTAVNLTDIKAKLIPWVGFLPPIRGEVGF